MADSDTPLPLKTEQLILYKLDELAKGHTNLGEKLDANASSLHRKIDAHAKDMSLLIHGNGTPGIKSQVEVLKSRVALISLVAISAWTAIVASYIKLRGS